MERVKISIAEIEYHDDLVILRVNEGSDVSTAVFEQLRAMFDKRYSGRFGWVSDRIHSYSVDPTSVEAVFGTFDKLVCVAQVNYGDPNKDSSDLAAGFLPKPFGSFVTLDKALEWVREQLRDTAD